MNNDNDSTGINTSVDNNNDAPLNETENIRSSEMDQSADETQVKTANNAEGTIAIEDDIRALEGGQQKTPGSSGAFPVGAFDTSKE